MKLKYKIISLVFLASLLGCANKNPGNKEVTSDLIQNPLSASSVSSTNELPEIKFDKESHDFGLVLQGEKVSYTFKFKNIGKGNLIVKDASTSCGCTIPKFSREPIPTGGTGEIEVIFDTNNRFGRQLKTVTVWTNCQPNQSKLQIVSEIVVPK